jgi:uncharacterized DUF497 family protein
MQGTTGINGYKNYTFMFVFDLRKSLSNKQKHGIDFGEAKLIWKDPDAIELESDYEDEARFSVIGSIDGVIWTAIVTYRGHATRLISVRRARRDERKVYFSQRA